MFICTAIQGVREKIVQRKDVKVITNETYINITNEVLAFECRLFQLIWMLQSGDIAIFPKEVKEPIVPLFDEWDKIMHNYSC